MFALALLLTLPLDLPPRTDCDCVEINHVYSDCGDHCLSQVILWDHSPRGDLCHGWTMASTPRAMANGRLWVWRGEKIREVRFREWRETWTQFDPERENISKHSIDRRKWE